MMAVCEETEGSIIAQALVEQPHSVSGLVRTLFQPQQNITCSTYKSSIRSILLSTILAVFGRLLKVYRGSKNRERILKKTIVTDKSNWYSVRVSFHSFFFCLFIRALPQSNCSSYMLSSKGLIFVHVSHFMMHASYSGLFCSEPQTIITCLRAFYSEARGKRISTTNKCQTWHNNLRCTKFLQTLLLKSQVLNRTSIRYSYLPWTTVPIIPKMWI